MITLLTIIVGMLSLAFFITIFFYLPLFTLSGIGYVIYHYINKHFNKEKPYEKR